MTEKGFKEGCFQTSPRTCLKQLDYHVEFTNHSTGSMWQHSDENARNSLTRHHSVKPQPVISALPCLLRLKRWGITRRWCAFMSIFLFKFLRKFRQNITQPSYTTIYFHLIWSSFFSLSGVRAVFQTQTWPQCELGRQDGVHQRLVSPAHRQRHVHHYRQLHQNWDRVQGNMTHREWSSLVDEFSLEE